MSSQPQDMSVQQPLADLHQNSSPETVPARDTTHPFHLSATLDEYYDDTEEVDENIPPPGPSRVVYPLPGVRMGEIRSQAQDAFDALIERSTMTARADNFALFDDMFDNTKTAPLPPSPVESLGNTSRPFSTYNGPLADVPLRYFVHEVEPKDRDSLDNDVDEGSLPPLLISPDLRNVSEDD
ncbi:hypothetical protein BD413DRAFT_616066 [Trametes elegans]|nr:hypothetical protein BD413DRAFT_616066 [Trametes elegans]